MAGFDIDLELDLVTAQMPTNVIKAHKLYTYCFKARRDVDCRRNTQ